jgi:hypothetical protein
MPMIPTHTPEIERRPHPLVIPHGPTPPPVILAMTYEGMKITKLTENIGLTNV